MYSDQLGNDKVAVGKVKHSEILKVVKFSIRLHDYMHRSPSENLVHQKIRDFSQTVRIGYKVTG